MSLMIFLAAWYPGAAFEKGKKERREGGERRGGEGGREGKARGKQSGRDTSHTLETPPPKKKKKKKHYIKVPSHISLPSHQSEWSLAPQLHLGSPSYLQRHSNQIKYRGHTLITAIIGCTCTSRLTQGHTVCIIFIQAVKLLISMSDVQTVPLYFMYDTYSRLYNVIMWRALSSCLLYSWMRFTWQSNMDSGFTLTP